MELEGYVAGSTFSCPKIDAVPPLFSQITCSLLHLNASFARIIRYWKAGGMKMRDPTVNGEAHVDDPVVPFAPKGNGSVAADQLDKAGSSILTLLYKAADVADDNTRHARDMAQKLSHQLRAAKQRISELEAEVASSQDQAERAEQWLHKVYTEIEERFVRQENRRNGTR